MDVFTNYNGLHKDQVIKRKNFFKYVLISIDVIIILVAYQLSYFIACTGKTGFFYTEKSFLILFFAILPFWLLVLYLVRKTGIPTKRYKVLSLLYMQSSVAAFLILTLVYFFFKLYSVPRLFLITLPAIGFILQFFGRILIYIVFKRYIRRDNNNVIAIIIADDSSVTFIENLLSNKKLGYKAVVIFSESSLIKSKFESLSIILPEKFLEIINDLIEVDFVDEVLYLKEKSEPNKIREILEICEDLGVTFRLKYSIPKKSLASAVKTDIADGKFLSFINIPNNSYALAIKKTTDINLALLMIVVLSPLFILISVLVKLTSRGPVISKVSKIGWRGRQVKAYRFRTMYSNSGKKNFYPKFKKISKKSRTEAKDKQRLTIIGSFLQKSGMEELPQLFNVLKGEMSIIGPRHPLESENVKSFNRKYS